MDAILDASRLICDTLSAGGRWWVFGTGHSHMIAEEFYGRAGGLTDIHPILEPALMLHESLTKSTLLERRAGLADDLLEVHGLTRGDVIVIASNSGRNAVPVEMAEGAQQRGVAVIAITSMAHSRSVTSRAPSGKKLFELADVVIDNCGTPGDAAVDGEQGGVGATVLVSASHTHSAPGAWCGTIHPLLPAALDLAQIDAVAHQIGSALPQVRSVDLVQSVAPVTGVGSNRNDPARPVDTTVGVLAALLPGNHSAGPIGLIVDHACHPTVLGPDSTAWSPDWVTGLRDGLAASLGPVPVLFLQGAAGDVSTRFTRRCPTTAEAIRIGRRVAAGALSALESARPVDPADGIDAHRAGSYEATSSYADAAEARRLLSELTAIATLTGPAGT
ncbi:sugar isomerase domain-containing protein [Acidipropionibacterium jensenii]|uniref:sugar isomerase domain-containing protein n=1 Tax=Acidipropionibacterium jensenii TaxID=1749 RepID=UPI001F1B95BA|nr:sugar isomerase domain-containing protein [Acidipropionibacterium jensenii]